MITMMMNTFITRNYPSVLLPIYKSYVRPIIDYACPVWSPYLKKDIDKIEKIQRRFTRFFPHLRSLDYRARL